MKRLLLLTILALAVSPQSVLGWGRKGHDAIAYIAECHLTKKAKNNIAKYLEHPIVYYASWMDEYRKTPEYIFSDKWHVGYVDENLRNTEEVRKPEGDCVRELENAIARLKDYRTLDDSTVAVNLKYIIHLAGDMHCPSHVYYKGKPGFRVKLNGTEMSYHAVWDSGVLDASNMWSYTEYQQMLDLYTKKERDAISAGTPLEWFEQSAADCIVIYDWAGPGDQLGKDFVNKARTLPEQQIVKAGYRLARILNELFG